MGQSRMDIYELLPSTERESVIGADFNIDPIKTTSYIELCDNLSVKNYSHLTSKPTTYK